MNHPLLANNRTLPVRTFPAYPRPTNASERGTGRSLSVPSIAVGIACAVCASCLGLDAKAAATVSGGTFTLPPTHYSDTSTAVNMADFNQFDPSLGTLLDVVWTETHMTSNLAGAVANASSYRGLVDVHETSGVGLGSVPGANDGGLPGSLYFPDGRVEVIHPGVGTVSDVADDHDPFMPGPGTFTFSFTNSTSGSDAKTLTSSLASYEGVGTFSIFVYLGVAAIPYQAEGPNAGESFPHFVNGGTLSWDGSQTLSLTYEYVPVPEPAAIGLFAWGLVGYGIFAGIFAGRRTARCCR